MRAFLCVLLASVMVVSGCKRQGEATDSGATAPVVPGPDSAGQPEAKAKAKQLLQAMVDKDFALVMGQFDKAMEQALPGDKLEQVWKAQLQKVGAFREVRGAREGKVQGHTIVTLQGHFERGDLDIRMSFDSEHRLAGLFFLSPKTAEPAKPPPYARQDAFTEKDVVIGDGEWALPGTLTTPKGPGPFPIVVLLAGSGPQDRDETIGPNKPLRDIAWGLASQEIAAVRYEKRTCAHRSKMAKLQDTITPKEEVIDDALAAIGVARRQERIDPKKVFVLGHSLGAFAGPQVAAGDNALAGLVLLAGNVRPLEDVILDQINYISFLKGTLSAEERKELDKLKQQVARVKGPALTPETPAGELPLGSIPAAYWLWLRNYDQARTAARLPQPLLVLQGERDYQVTMEDFAGWQKALAGKKNAELKSYPALNHLFMEGKGKATPAEYETPQHVAKEVIDDIAAWIKKQ